MNNVVNRLGLTTWMGSPRANALTDIVVPPEQVEAFSTEMAVMKPQTMHEDLGVSIEVEGRYGVYAGAYFRLYSADVCGWLDGICEG